MSSTELDAPARPRAVKGRRPPRGSLTTPRPAAHPALVLTVLATATFIAVLDVWITNVGLPAIGRGVGESSLSNLSWTLSAYAIVYAALLVPAGRLADRYGRKGGFVIGLGVFVAGSLGAGLSNDIWVLVGFRIVQAIGAAALTPTSLGLVLTSAPPDRVNKYVKIWFTSGALAASAGPVLGGLLIEVSWQWLFFVNIPIGLLALAAAARWVPNTKHDDGTKLPDAVGGLLLTVAIAALALGLVQGPDWGWGSAGVVVSLVVSLASAVGFVLRSTHHASPVVQLSLLRDRVFSAGNATSLLLLGAFAIELLGGILWMQAHWGYSAIKTGLATAPGPMLVPVFATIADALQHKARVPAGVLVSLGATLVALGAVLFAISIGNEPNYLTGFLPSWLTVGVGFGLALPTVMSAATANLPPAQSSTGSAVLTMSQQIGSVIGISVLVAILGEASGGAELSVFQSAWGASAAIAALAAIAGLAITAPRDGRAAVPAAAESTTGL